MSSDTAAASKQTSNESSVGSGVGHGEISDPTTKGTGDVANTKGEVVTDHDGEGDHDSAASENIPYHPRGPPNHPSHGRPIKR